MAAKVVEHGLAAVSTLELGSLDVNGSVRGFFHGPYIGVDIRDGPGVDEVMDAEALRFDGARFNCVVSTEMLEHVARPWVVISEAARVLKVGGHLLVTARGYSEHGCFPIHDHPDDIYRYSSEALRVLVTDHWLHVVELIHDTDPGSPGWFLHARKG